jgi:hypothetical protein
VEAHAVEADAVEAGAVEAEAVLVDARGRGGSSSAYRLLVYEALSY